MVPFGEVPRSDRAEVRGRGDLATASNTGTTAAGLPRCSGTPAGGPGPANSKGGHQRKAVKGLRDCRLLGFPLLGNLAAPDPSYPS